MSTGGRCPVSHANASPDAVCPFSGRRAEPQPSSDASTTAVEASPAEPSMNNGKESGESVGRCPYGFDSASVAARANVSVSSEEKKSWIEGFRSQLATCFYSVPAEQADSFCEAMFDLSDALRAWKAGSAQRALDSGVSASNKLQSLSTLFSSSSISSSLDENTRNALLNEVSSALGTIHSKLAVWTMTLGNYDHAAPYIASARTYLMEAKDEHSLRVFLLQAGNAAVLCGAMEVAQQMLKELVSKTSADVELSGGDARRVFDAAVALGSYARTLLDAAEAKTELQRVVDMLKQIETKPETEEFGSMYRSYRQMYEDMLVLAQQSS